MRPYFEREDYTFRKLARIKRTKEEKQWEEKNPGYELHALNIVKGLEKGTELFFGGEGKILLEEFNPESQTLIDCEGKTFKVDIFQQRAIVKVL